MWSDPEEPTFVFSDEKKPFKPSIPSRTISPQRSRFKYFLLAILLGHFGAHNIYTYRYWQAGFQTVLLFVGVCLYTFRSPPGTINYMPLLLFPLPGYWLWAPFIYPLITGGAHFDALRVLKFRTDHPQYQNSLLFCLTVLVSAVQCFIVICDLARKPTDGHGVELR